jgi:hypothetical protein
VKTAKYRENKRFAESVGDALRQFQIFKEVSKLAHVLSLRLLLPFAL